MSRIEKAPNDAKDKDDGKEQTPAVGPLWKDFLSMPGGLQPGLSEFASVARREEPPVKVSE